MAHYRQLAPHRDVTGENNFSNGPINFRFQTGSSVYVVPNRCYFRMRCKLGTRTAAGGAVSPLSWKDDLAPNINFGHHLFQNAEWRIGDKTVSRISDFMPQIGALHQRLNTSKPWRETTGRFTNFTNYSFTQRQSDTRAGGSYVTGESVVFPLLDGMVADNARTATENRALAEAVANFTVAAAYVNNEETGTFTITSANANGDPVKDQLKSIIQLGDYLKVFGRTTGAVNNNEYLVKVLSVPEGGDAHANAATRDITFRISRPAGMLHLGNVAYGLTMDGNESLMNIDVVKGDGMERREASEFEVCFQLPMSIWDHEKGIPGAEHNLMLNPLPADVLKKAITQSLQKEYTNTEIVFNIESFYLTLYEISGPPVTDTEFLIDLETIRLQTDNTITNGNLSQKIFDVSPSTYALAVAYQDNRAGGSDTRISSAQFRFFNPTLSYEGTNQLSRFYIQYAGQQFPSPDADPSLIKGKKDQTTERYMQTMLESGQYYTLAEDLAEWRARGPFYYFLTPRDNTDKSTRVQINQAFTDENANLGNLNDSLGNMRILLFDLSRQVAVITMQGGNVTNVSLQDQ